MSKLKPCLFCKNIKLIEAISMIDGERRIRCPICGVEAEINDWNAGKRFELTEKEHVKKLLKQKTDE